MPTNTVSETIVRPAAKAEHQALKSLLHEFKDIESLLFETQSYADPDARIRFDYTALRRDFRMIVSGIEAYLSGSTRQSQFIEPISGDYGR